MQSTLFPSNSPSRSATPSDADAGVSISIEVEVDASGDNHSQHIQPTVLTPPSPGLLTPPPWVQDWPHHTNPIHPRSAPPTPQVGFNAFYRLNGTFSRSEENLTLIQNLTLSAYDSPSPSAGSDDYSYSEALSDGYPPPSPISDTSSVHQLSLNPSDEHPGSDYGSGVQNILTSLHPDYPISLASTLSSPGQTPLQQHQLHTYSDPRNKQRLQRLCPSPSPTTSPSPLPQDDTLDPSTTSDAPSFLTGHFPFIQFLDLPQPSFFPSEGGLQGTPASASMYKLPTSSSSSLSFLPSPASASHPNDPFSMPVIVSADDTLVSQPEGQFTQSSHDNPYYGPNWTYEAPLTQTHGEQQSLTFESQQATSGQLKRRDYQSYPPPAAGQSAITSDPFTPFPMPPSSGAGPAGKQQPGTLDATYMPPPAEDDSVEEMKEQIVDLLADASNINEGRNRIRILGAEKGSSLPEVLFNQAAKRTVGTIEVRNAAYKRKLKDACFACVFCPYKLTAKDNLKNHYRSHLDYKPCRCQASGCGMRFGNPSGLKRHMEKRHHVLQPSKRARPKSVHRPESG